MEQVKAPKKIYIDPEVDPIWDMSERYNEGDIEYTQTDVFIEKSVNWLINNTDITPTGIKNFRKAMKSEQLWDNI